MIQREPDEGKPDSIDTEINEGDIETIRQALTEEKNKSENYLANWQRTQADFINYKRRCEQEKEEIGKFANLTFILDLLPFLDDLERAFAAIPPKLANLNWINGIQLVERKLIASLESQGLTPIPAVGEPFDPHLHEALRQDAGKEGIVIEEVQKGYKLHDRVVRPSRVIIGNGQ